ncbi:MAG: 1-acyl-sn-glycerol-3-phosphate acyltransferase [Candidatus Rokubacteria bacterium]|nr:1-acyl-sn-glycerol-3-phosphate acyltransferase [Candidatus Rokubacteria bacterium]
MGGPAPLPPHYRLLRGLAQIVLDIFYRRIEVVGTERLPARGPLIITANHQNALVDPLLLIAAIPRRLVPLAKAPLFRLPVIGALARWAGAIPVERPQDAPGQPVDNEAMFAQAVARLRQDEAILIFPEGLSQPDPKLMPLRTGAARLLLQAAAATGGPVTLVPVGLVYHEPGAFRLGRAWVLIGEPVPTADCVFLHAREPEAAARQLTERLAQALRVRIVEAEDRDTLRLLAILKAMGRPARRRTPRHAWPGCSAPCAATGRSVTSPPRASRASAKEVERLAKDLELAGLTGLEPAGPSTLRAAWRHALREGASLLLGLPLAAWGIASHALPYQATRLAVQALRPVPDVEATSKILAGLLFYPLAWIAEGWLAWRLGGGWWLALFLVALLPAGFFALSWRERMRRLSREARGLLAFLAGGSLRRRLEARRRRILQELAELARLLPESAPDGEVAERP